MARNLGFKVGAAARGRVYLYEIVTPSGYCHAIRAGHWKRCWPSEHKRVLLVGLPCWFRRRVLGMER